MNIGDRVKYKTIGGWYNSGIIRDMNENSYLIEVDKSEDIPLLFSYYSIILSSCEVISEDKEYETEVITRGNCMMCGKELTEGLFFCKECENKANSRKEKQR